MTPIPLGDICEFKYGKSLPESKRADGPIAVFGSNGRVGTHVEALTNGPTIIVGRKGSVGEITYSPDPCWPIDTTYYVDSSATSHNIRWLYYALKSLRLSELNKATGVPGLNRNDAYERRLLLPEQEEQIRTAAILDKADSIQRKRSQSLAMADSFLKSVFLSMFGDPVHNSKDLPTIALGDLIKVSSGNGLTAKNMDSSGTFPVYGGNGINGYHSEFMFDEPKIVIGRVGVYCGAVHVTQPKAWVTDNALYVRELKRQVNLTYLEWALRFADLNQYADRAAQPLISGSRIYPIEIVLPANKEQSSFALVAERKHKLRSLIEDQGSQTDDLLASISQRAFRGELRGMRDAPEPN